MKKALTFQDIHDEAFESNLKENILHKEIKEFSQQYARSLKYSDCPCCLSRSVERSFNCLGFDYFVCRDCETLYINPCPSEADIIHFLNTSKGMETWRKMPATVKQSRSKMYEDRYAMILQHVNQYLPGKEKLKVLEIGSGNGELATILCENPLFEEMHLIEPQELDIKNPKVSLFRGSFSEFKKKDYFDLVLSYEVLEHLVSPYEFFQLTSDALKPGGMLILTTPNADSLEVKLLKEQSPTVPFDHIRLYTPKALEHLVQKFSMNLLHISTPGKFDVDIILRNATEGFDSDIMMAFKNFLGANDTIKQKFQEYLRDHKFSSHMVCVAQKKS